MSTTFTTADLATIEAAIASGALRVRFADGREVYYQTTTELRSARDTIRQALLEATTAAEQAQTPRMRRVVHVRDW